MAVMNGNYILHFGEDGHYQILIEKKNGVYTTVVPDAGYSHDFAKGLVDLLNSQINEASHE